MSAEGPSPWRLPRLSLFQRLLLLLSAVITFILLGQTLFALSTRVTGLNNEISANATILAQSIAGSCAGLMQGENPNRFDSLIERVRKQVDLIDLVITDRAGRVLSHSDPGHLGKDHDLDVGIFATPRTKFSLASALRAYQNCRVTAPIVRGTEVLGYVVLAFRSREVAESATRHLKIAAALGLFWLLIGAGVGSLYVRRITRPLARLTAAASLVSGGRLEGVEIDLPRSKDEVGVLQASFAHLLEALRAESQENARLMAEQQHQNTNLRSRVDEVTADLRETTAYLRSVLRCMGEGVITCDPDGRIVQVNAAAHDHLRGLGDLREGRHIAEVIPDGGPLASAVAEANERETKQRIVLRRPPPGAGDERTISFRVQPLRGMESASLGAVVTVVDETERQLVEAKLRRHDRLVSLGTVAAGLAHELGNYMNSINGFSSILLRETSGADIRRSDVQAIHDENSAAIELLDRFLQFARLGCVHFAPEPIALRIEDALGMCKYRLAELGVEVKLELEEAQRTARCDGHLLAQVFVNLILNAADAMSSAKVRVLTIRMRWREERVRIEFIDTGSGIAREDLERIFDPFFTTKDTSGTGLGLSIAHQVVDRHGGSISAQSLAEEGATFTLTLPTSGPEEA